MSYFKTFLFLCGQYSLYIKDMSHKKACCKFIVKWIDMNFNKKKFHTNMFTQKNKTHRIICESSGSGNRT